jgi:hypothetical protein
MAAQPTTEFGKRRPVAIPTAQPVKRSRHVALLLMGTLAVGGSAYALMPSGKCEPNGPGMAAPPVPQGSTECPRGFSSGIGHGGSWSRSSFFGGDPAGERASSGAASESGSGGVIRGGFGAFARAFTAHFSGGG